MVPECCHCGRSRGAFRICLTTQLGIRLVLTREVSHCIFKPVSHVHASGMGHGGPASL